MPRDHHCFFHTISIILEPEFGHFMGTLHGRLLLYGRGLPKAAPGALWHECRREGKNTNYDPWYLEFIDAVAFVLCRKLHGCYMVVGGYMIVTWLQRLHVYIRYTHIYTKINTFNTYLYIHKATSSKEMKKSIISSYTLATPICSMCL